MGGTCGDLIACIIDSKNSIVRTSRVLTPMNRAKLKRADSFDTDDEKDNYLVQIALQYKSIPSHDIEYHVRKKHEFISIGIRNRETAIWAAARFKTLHNPNVWTKIMDDCKITTLEDYSEMLLTYSSMVMQHTEKVIYLEDIVNGSAIERLQLLVSSTLDTAFYQSWLAAQR